MRNLKKIIQLKKTYGDKIMLNNQKGFTLIELMVVVVIIGILAAIALPNFLSMQDRAKESEVKANVHTVQLSVEDFKTNTSVNPTGAKPTLLATAPVPAAPAAGTVYFPASMKNPFDTTKTGAAAVWYVDDDGSAIALGANSTQPGGQVEYHSGITAAVAYVIVGAGKPAGALANPGKIVAKVAEGQ